MNHGYESRTALLVLVRYAYEVDAAGSNESVHASLDQSGIANKDLYLHARWHQRGREC